MTGAALELLIRTEPHWQALLEEVGAGVGGRPKKASEKRNVRLGVSETLLMGAFAQLPQMVTALDSQVRLELSTHRSPVLWEKFRQGDFDVAICVVPEN